MYHIMPWWPVIIRLMYYTVVASDYQTDVSYHAMVASDYQTDVLYCGGQWLSDWCIILWWPVIIRLMYYTVVASDYQTDVSCSDAVVASDYQTDVSYHTVVASDYQTDVSYHTVVASDYQTDVLYCGSQWLSDWCIILWWPVIIRLTYRIILW